jgi:hypothetical protein
MYRYFLYALILLAIFGTGATFWYGWDYYALPLSQRGEHALYALLKPGGQIGHGLGFLGTFLLGALFLYTLRKKWKRLSKFGNVRIWLLFHIFCGIAGPVFITLHTSFKVGGLVAWSYWSMMAVMLSGFIGRFLYAQIPRTLTGTELSREDLAQKTMQLSREMAQSYSFSEEAVVAIDRFTGMKRDKVGLGAIWAIFADDLSLWYRLHALQRLLLAESKINRTDISRLLSMIKERSIVERKIAYLSTAQQLFHYWHVIHRPFAYAMIIIAVIHILVAALLGYTWVF